MATALTNLVHDTDVLTKPPFLRRVRIRGYKSIGFCDVQLHPLTILVGRNAAGKSNFLDALAFLRDTMQFGVAEAVKRRGGWNSVASRTRAVPTIEIEIETGFVGGPPLPLIQATQDEHTNSNGQSSLQRHQFAARYFVQIASRDQGPAVIRREVLDLSDNTANKEIGFDQSRLENGVNMLARRGDGWSAEFTMQALSPRSDLSLLSVIGFQPFLEFSEGLRLMGFCNFNPEEIRRLQKPNPGWLLDKDGRNLASVIEGLKEIEPESVQRVRQYLSLIAEDVGSFDVIRYGENETVRFRLRQDSDNPPVEFDAANMSDGTLRVLATLMAAFQMVLPRGYPAVVGIEKPETALHPAAMRALVDALDDATQRTQILLTTHSADLLSGRDVVPGQVLIVRNRDQQTLIAPIDPASQEIIRKELYSLADLQRMDKLDLDESDLRRQAELSRREGA